MSEDQRPFEGGDVDTKPHICTDLSPRVVEAAQALGRAIAGAGLNLDEHVDLVRQQIQVGHAGYFYQFEPSAEA